MKKNFILPQHATPIDDISGLKLSGLTTYRELSEQEAENILIAKNKYFSSVRNRRFVVSEPFLKKVHREMFGKVWKWTGGYRKIQTNIGVY